jgi:hypothetical protein
MKNFTSRKTIVVLTIVALFSTVMAVNSVTAAAPIAQPDDTKYISPTFMDLNVGGAATLGSATVNGELKTNTIASKTGGSVPITITAAGLLVAQIGALAGNPLYVLSPLKVTSISSYGPDNIVRIGNGVTLDNTLEVSKISNKTGNGFLTLDSSAYTTINSPRTIIDGNLEVKNVADGKGKITAKDLTVTGTLAPTNLTVSNLTTTKDLTVTGTFSPATLAVTNNATVGGTLGVTGATTLSTLNVGTVANSQFISNPSTGLNTINSTASITRADQTAPLVIKSFSGNNVTSWMGFLGDTIYSTGTVFSLGIIGDKLHTFKIRSYGNDGTSVDLMSLNAMGTMTIKRDLIVPSINAPNGGVLSLSGIDLSGQITGNSSGGAVTIGSDLTVINGGNLSVEGTTTLKDLIVNGSFTPSSLTVTNDAAVNGNLNVTSATAGKGRITTKDLSVTGTFSPSNLAVTNNATVGNKITTKDLSVTGTFSPTNLTVSNIATLGLTILTNNTIANTADDATIQLSNYLMEIFTNSENKTGANTIDVKIYGDLETTKGAKLDSLAVTNAASAKSLNISENAIITGKLSGGELGRGYFETVQGEWMSATNGQTKTNSVSCSAGRFPISCGFIIPDSSPNRNGLVLNEMKINPTDDKCYVTATSVITGLPIITPFAAQITCVRGSTH